MKAGVAPVLNAVLDTPLAKVAGKKNVVARHRAAQRCCLIRRLFRYFEYPRMIEVVRACLHNLSLRIHNRKLNYPRLGRIAQKRFDELGQPASLAY